MEKLKVAWIFKSKCSDPFRSEIRIQICELFLIFLLCHSLNDLKAIITSDPRRNDARSKSQFFSIRLQQIGKALMEAPAS